MAGDLSVRVMRPDEWAAVRAVCVEAFGGDESLGELLDLLRASWSWHDELSFVAVMDDRVVGDRVVGDRVVGDRVVGDRVVGEYVVAMVLFSSAFVDAPDRVVPVLVLSPVGVWRDLQRRGIGDRLIRYALEQLASRPEPVVFLEGIPSYYPRFGFRPARSMGFTPPSVRIPDRAFMALPLPSYDPSLRGALVYPDALWRADAVGLRE